MSFEYQNVALLCLVAIPAASLTMFLAATSPGFVNIDAATKPGWQISTHPLQKLGPELHKLTPPNRERQIMHNLLNWQIPEIIGNYSSVTKKAPW